MMEIDIPSTSRSLLDRLLNGRSSVTYSEIQTSPLPSFVKAWFHLGVESWYAPEYRWRSSSTRFNYKEESLQALLNALDEAVKSTAAFSREDCSRIIEGALRHETAYANDPVGALSSLLFQRSEVVDGVHVVDLLAHFQREPFFEAAVKSYVVEHDDTRLDRDILQHFMTEAERQAYVNQPIDALQASVHAVSEILGLIGGNGRSNEFHADIWEQFAEARRLNETMPEIIAAIETTGAESDAFNVDALTATLAKPAVITMDSDDVSVEPVEESPALPEEQVETLEEAVSPGEDLPSSVASMEEAVSPGEDTPPSEETGDDQTEVDTTPAPPSFAAPDIEPVASTFSLPAKDETSTLETDTPSAFAVPADYAMPVNADKPPADHSIDAQDQADEEDLLKKTVANTGTSSNIAAPPVEISDKLQKMFVKKLFNKDEAAYTSTVEQLEPALSWEEAFSIIEEIWQQRGLNLFSKESQEFTRVYYERYFPSS